jgi:hypothetical protein
LPVLGPLVGVFRRDEEDDAKRLDDGTVIFFLGSRDVHIRDKCGS